MIFLYKSWSLRDYMVRCIKSSQPRSLSFLRVGSAIVLLCCLNSDRFWSIASFKRSSLLINRDQSVSVCPNGSTTIIIYDCLLVSPKWTKRQMFSFSIHFSSSKSSSVLKNPTLCNWFQTGNMQIEFWLFIRFCRHGSRRTDPDWPLSALMFRYVRNFLFVDCRFVTDNWMNQTTKSIPFFVKCHLYNECKFDIFFYIYFNQCSHLPKRKLDASSLYQMYK